MSPSYDAILIGGGHNGLVAAATLAQNGLNVLLLERRECLGGAAATEEVFSGFKFNTGAHDAGLFRPEIVEALELSNYGLDFIDSQVAAFAPQPDGRALTLWRDIDKTAAEIARFSQEDAERYPAYLDLASDLTDVLKSILTLTPPDLPRRSLAELLPWAKTALKAKRLGDKRMMELLRILPLTAKEFLDEWFEGQALKGLLGSTGVAGSMQGPQSAGTAFMMLYQQLGAANGGFKSSRFVRGGLGQLSAALAQAAREHGAQIRTGAEVSRLVIEGGEATGVVLASGEEFKARLILSNADPRRTLFELAGPTHLEPRAMRRVRNIKYRGSTAKLNLALSGLPEFVGAPDGANGLSGHIVLCPSLEYLERAYDDAKYGRVSQRPYLDITIPSILDPSLAPEGQHVMSITMRYAPYHLREGDWEGQRDALGDLVVETIAGYAPNISDLILHRQVVTPLDWERDYGLTEGSVFHGQMGLDQLLFMRPIAGYGQYRTPIENLYLCGAGTHPGGGVTGAPGYNAARQALKDLRK